MNNDLQHHGIKGQKWGVRRYQNKDGSLTPEGRKKYADSIADTKAYTKKGVEVILRRQPTPLISKVVGKLSKSAQTNAARSDFMNITVGGKKVGDLQLYKEDPKSLNVVWVSVNPKHEGNGYGQTVMKAVVDYAKKQNLDRVTLEVPTISPNARHIYESIGFKSKGMITDTDDMWGGLTAMELNLRENDGDNLQHHGIKGQKWGRRRYQNKDGSLTPAGVQRYGSKENFEVRYDEEVKTGLRAGKKLADGSKELARASKEYEGERSRKKQKKADKALEEAVRDKARGMSDQELRDAVNRLNMEENYTRMMQNRERIDAGESKAAKFMDHSMTALTLASTTLSIALAVKELKK